MGDNIAQQEVKRGQLEADIKAQIEDIEENRGISGVRKASDVTGGAVGQSQEGVDDNGDTIKEIERLKNKVKSMELQI